MEIGFLGLGAMGVAMAHRLVDAGHGVTVWNRSPGPGEKLAGFGAAQAETASGAIAKPVVISMLANDAAVESVFSRQSLAAAPAGAVHVNMASIGVDTAERLQALHQAAGVDYLAAPVLGRPPVAAAGKLTVVVGGPTEALERVRPILDQLGQRIWHVAESAAEANLVKIGVNYTIIHALQALAESVTLVERGGVDPGIFVDILTASLFPGPVYEGYGHMVAERRYVPPGFTMTLGRKDLRLAQEAAQAHGVQLDTMPTLVEAFETALADADLAELDWAALAEVTRSRSGAPTLSKRGK